MHAVIKSELDELTTKKPIVTAEEKFMTLALESKQNHAKAKLLIMQLLDQV